MGATLKSRILSFFAASADRGAETIRVSCRTGPVALITIPPPEREGAEAESLLDVLRETAIGRTTYALSAHTGEGDTVAATSLVVEGKAGSDIGIEASTERDPVVAHLLRHQDSILGQQTRALSGLLDHYRDALERSTRRIAELESTLERLRATYEEAVSLKHEREAASEERKAAQARIDRSFDALVRIAGPILSKKMGVDIPVPPNPDKVFVTNSGGDSKDADLASFLSSLTPAQIDGIAALLSEEQTKKLMKLAGMG